MASLPTADASAPAPVPATLSLAALAAFLIALLAQGVTLRGAAILDDVPVVLRNPALERGPALELGPASEGGGGGLRATLTTPQWPGELERGPYRPLAVLSFALERRVTGGRPVAAFGHGVNLVLHALVAALTAHLLLRLRPGRPLLALAAGLLVAVHPLATTALAPLTGRAVLLGSVFGLLALHACIGARQGRGASAAWAGAFLLLALLSCEALAGLALLPFLLGALAGPGTPRGPARTTVALHLAWWAALAAWAVLWARHGPGEGPVVVPDAGIPERLALGAEALARTAQRLFVPVGFLADRTHVSIAGEGWPLVGERLVLVFVVVVLLAAALFVPLRRGAAGALRAVLLAAGTLLVTAALTLPLGAVLEDRWAYVALPALAVLAGLAAEAVVAWSREAAWRRTFTRFLPGLALLAFTLLSVRVAQSLADDDAVHAQLIAVPQGHGPARLRRAERLLRNAAEDRAQSARLPARHQDPMLDPGRGPLLHAAQKARAEAHDLLLAAVRHPATRDDPSAWLLLGTLQLEESRPGEAFESLSLARRLDPVLADRGNPSVRHDARALARAARIQAALMRAYGAQGRPQAAADAALEVVRREREAGERGGTLDLRLLQQAALVLLADGRYSQGLDALEQVGRLTTDDVLRREAIDHLEKAKQDAAERVSGLLAQGREQQESVDTMRLALDAYEEALRIDPDSFEARYWSAQLRGMHFGSYERALESVREGLERLRRTEAGAERDRRENQLRELEQRLTARRAEEEAEER
jgi:tetratricopeptide (TPR) repeat protein